MTNLEFKEEQLTPQQIVDELDAHIVGQKNAKRAVAVALRNRWRRAKLPKSLQAEIKPKNILMIGPTGVGKTEIARRLSALVQAPFIKVEATKFTEVGYVGRDVESIVRDLTDVAVKQTRELEMAKVKDRARENAEDKILNILLPTRGAKVSTEDQIEGELPPEIGHEHEYETDAMRNIFRRKLREGQFDEREIELDLSVMPVGVEIMGPPGMEEMTSQLQQMFSSLSGSKKKTKKMKVKNALKQLTEEEAARLVNEDELRAIALEKVEQHGIVFIDELDKITQRGNVVGADVSREGVQRDLLPLIEGCSVFTKYGMVRTDHILFIASGAFQLSKPSDLVPELQGRLPIRVELDALVADDFVRILTEPRASLVEQYIALLETEGVKLEFTKTGIRRIAEIAYEVNKSTENIGARRLYTILERLLENISFNATNLKKKQVIDAKYIDSQLSTLLENEDLSHYIL